MVLGAEGQTGRELCRFIEDPIEVTHNKGQIKAEYANEGALSTIIHEYSPDLIINTVALTNVDKCETDMAKAYRLNATAVREIVHASQHTGSKLVHISTDYVFDGKKGNYRESDIPNPLNFYGLSKLMGDCYADAMEHSLIIRTSGVYGYSNNFPKFVHDSLKNGREINTFPGYYSPIHAFNLARAIIDLISMNHKGLINIAGERISRYDLSVLISRHFNLPGAISEVPNPDNMIAKRPFDSSLNIDRAKGLLNFDFYTTESNLKQLERTVNIA